MAANGSRAKAKKPPKYRGVTFLKTEQCKGCGFCIEFCPTGALDFSTEFNKKGYHYPVMVHDESCNGCDLCGLYCPDFAFFAKRYVNPAYQAWAAEKKEK